MQIDTNAALITALISAVIGFGLAFYIERKLSGGMQNKSQKILTSIAMMSFGYGLMMTLNEVIGFPLQGLQIRYDKLAVYIAANILFLPIVLLAIAKLVGLKNKNGIADLNIQSNTSAGNFIKSIAVITAVGVVGVVAYLGYMAYETSTGDATYDFYERADYKNCYSPYPNEPDYSLKFTFKKETNEIFLTADFKEAGVKKQQFQKMESCSVLNSKNWSCGGEWTGTYQSPKYVYVNGEFSFYKGVSSLKEDANCAPKIVKR